MFSISASGGFANQLAKNLTFENLPDLLDWFEVRRIWMDKTGHEVMPF